MHRLDLNQAMAVVSGFGHIVVLPPNAEQAANGVIGIVCVKAGDREVVGSYAFCEGDERDFVNLQRFKHSGWLCPHALHLSKTPIPDG